MASTNDFWRGTSQGGGGRILLDARCAGSGPVFKFIGPEPNAAVVGWTRAHHRVIALTYGAALTRAQAQSEPPFEAASIRPSSPLHAQVIAYLCAKSQSTIITRRIAAERRVILMAL